MIALNLKHRVEPSSISNDSNDRDIQVHVNIYIHLFIILFLMKVQKIVKAILPKKFLEYILHVL